MSCHNIGHGLNKVVEMVLNLYDTGRVDRRAAVDIIRTARRSVYFCDGNEYEAVECMENTRCCRCLKKVAQDEKLYDLYDVSHGDRGIEDIPNKPEYSVAANYLCKECLDAVLEKYREQQK